MSFRATSAPTGSREDDAERDGHREFEVAVEREEDQENQENRERADDVELRFRFEQFAVLAAPIEVIAFGKLHGLGNGALSGLYDAFEVAAVDGKLDADVARIIFAIDEGCAGGFLDGGEFGERNLLAAGRGNEQVGDLHGVGAVLRLHAHDEIE